MKARFALVLGCFFLSGFSALVYETVWIRELGHVFGTSELAVAAVLAAYMGGLALGAAVAARLAPRLRSPVFVYGVLEFSIAACALAVPLGIRGLTWLYVGLLGGRTTLPEGDTPGVLLLQLVGAFAVLVPPTALMGATLPLLARYSVRLESQIGPRVGILYAVNTAGAIAGTLCAAFLLIPALGLRGTVYVGALLNLLIFVAAVAARDRPLAAAEAEAEESDARGVAGARWILPAIAVSGAASFVYEVMWTRLLGHLLGSSVYAFATMLASFLLGIALGSAVAAPLARSSERSVLGFATAQLGVALWAFATFSVADRLPELAHRIGAGHGSIWGSAGIAAVVLLPMTLCIGATFPFAVRIFAAKPNQAPAASARIYAWNTLGAVAGALAAGFVLLPTLGFAGTLRLGVLANLALAGATLLLQWHPARVRTALASMAGLLLVTLVAIPPSEPWQLLRTSPLLSAPIEGEIHYAGVGRSATVLLVDQGSAWQLLSSGLPESRIDHPASHPMVYAANWLGLLPALVRPSAQEVLIVGLGGGLALEALPPRFDAVDVVELEAEIIAANRSISAERARDPLADARVTLHLGDARGALMLGGRSYDAIISQPSHPWTAGSAHLYTREFFELVRSRLGPDGVFVQWIGVDLVDTELLRSLIATLLEAFPHLEVYQPNPIALLFVASEAPIDLIAGTTATLSSAPESFARYGIHRREDVVATRVLDSSGAAALAEGAELNTDGRNFLAMRASRLGEGAHDIASLRSQLEPYDPALAASAAVDRGAIIRRLLDQGFVRRAQTLAEAGSGAARETDLGWVELERMRPRTATRHFEEAYALAPEDRAVAAGWVLSQQAAIARGQPLAGLGPDPLSPETAALVAGWRHGDDWTAVAALDPELARLQPGEALFAAAARLRAEWRIESSDPEDRLVALDITNTLVLRGRRADDVLLRARAAAAADQPAAAWESLGHLARQLGPGTPGQNWILEQALEIASTLEESPRAKSVRQLLTDRKP